MKTAPVPVSAKIGLKFFRAEGCISYCVFDRLAREAVLIDPHFALFDDYCVYLSDNGLKVVMVVDSHTHADHYSASHLFRDRFGSEIGMSIHTQCERPTRKLSAGDKIAFGALRLNVLETPGHTPDGISLLLEGDQPGAATMVFTGDTLLIGGSGRTDFNGSDPTKLWDSLIGTLSELPATTVVFPGHDYGGILFSTIGIEKSSNRHLKMTSREEFERLKSSESIQIESEEVKHCLVFNRAAKPESAPLAGNGTVAGTSCAMAPVAPRGSAEIKAEKYRHKLDEAASGTEFIDVREPDEYAAGHMKGARNIPLSELAMHWEQISRASRIYCSCLSGLRSGMAVKTLSYLGFKDAVNVAGGFRAWQQAGLPVVKN